MKIDLNSALQFILRYSAIAVVFYFAYNKLAPWLDHLIPL